MRCTLGLYPFRTVMAFFQYLVITQQYASVFPDDVEQALTA